MLTLVSKETKSASGEAKLASGEANIELASGKAIAALGKKDKTSKSKPILASSSEGNQALMPKSKRISVISGFA